MCVYTFVGMCVSCFVVEFVYKLCKKHCLPTWWFSRPEMFCQPLKPAFSLSPDLPGVVIKS